MIAQRHWQRAGTILVLMLVWMGLANLIWYVPIPHRVNGELRTMRHGVLLWKSVNRSGRTEIHRPRLVGTSVLFLGTTAWLLLAVRRTCRNTRPRGICNACGYDTSTTRGDTNLCPECGSLPNLKQSVWAVWRRG
jgi:hypothetical protein